MILLFRLLRKILGWLDFVAFTGLMYLLSWLPWPGKSSAHPVARMFNAWCRCFVRARRLSAPAWSTSPHATRAR